jgi:hypothetical protein
MTAQEFMDELWLHLNPEIPPYTYGEKWLVEDPSTGMPIGDFDFESEYVRRYLNSGGYAGKVRDWGLKPGDTLAVRRI